MGSRFLALRAVTHPGMDLGDAGLSVSGAVSNPNKTDWLTKSDLGGECAFVCRETTV